MKIKNDIPLDIPDPQYLMFQFYHYILLDSEDRRALAKDHIKRLSSTFDLVLKNYHTYINSSFLLQWVVYLCDNGIHFLPNINLDADLDVYEPKLPFTKELMNKGFLTTGFAELFDNKFLFGFESRIWDGMSIKWNGDENSIVTFFVLLSFLKMLEPDGRFDTMKHGYRSGEKNKNKNERDAPFPNIPTLISGNYYNRKTDKKNFIVRGNGKWDTVNRRCEGIKSVFTTFFCEIIKKGDISKIDQESAIRHFVQNKSKLSRKKTKKDLQIDNDMIDLISAICKENLSKSNDRTNNGKRPLLRYNGNCL
jgi:hypothetical protein